MSSSGYSDNKNKDILILDKGPTQVLDDTALTIEEEYSINLSRWHKKLYLSLHYNGSSIFFLVML